MEKQNILSDITAEAVVSNCCGANVYQEYNGFGMCSYCYEHCGAVKVDEFGEQLDEYVRLQNNKVLERKGRG